jgi:hypothetical protein
MSYKFPIVAINETGLFGPTSREHFYKPVFYHNKTAMKNDNKNKWVLKQNEQYEVFRVSDEGIWNCKKNNGLFSILDNGRIILGGGEERLSFFPTPTNAKDAWHGFPVTSAEYEPSTELIDQWLKAKVIDQRMSIKILKGQI